MDERYRHETTHNGYSIFLDFFFLFICLHHQVWKRKMRRPSSIGKEKEPKFFFRRLCWPHRIQVIKNFRSRRLPFESAVHKTRTVATTAIKASGTGQKCFTCSTQHFLMSSYLFIPPAAWYLTLPLLFLYDSIELFVWGAVSCHKAAIILSKQQHTRGRTKWIRRGTGTIFWRLAQDGRAHFYDVFHRDVARGSSLSLHLPLRHAGVVTPAGPNGSSPERRRRSFVTQSVNSAGAVANPPPFLHVSPWPRKVATPHRVVMATTNSITRHVSTATLLIHNFLPEKRRERSWETSLSISDWTDWPTPNHVGVN